MQGEAVRTAAVTREEESKQSERKGAEGARRSNLNEAGGGWRGG